MKLEFDAIFLEKVLTNKCLKSASISFQIAKRQDLKYFWKLTCKDIATFLAALTASTLTALSKFLSSSRSGKISLSVTAPTSSSIKSSVWFDVWMSRSSVNDFQPFFDVDFSNLSSTA